jgi:hypothetical protein
MLPWSRFELTTSVVIGTDCIGSKSNYHKITATTALPLYRYLLNISILWYFNQPYTSLPCMAGVLNTKLCDKVCQWLAAERVLRFPPPIKLTAHDITEMLMKVVLNTITLTHITASHLLFLNCHMLYTFSWGFFNFILEKFKFH